MPTTSNVIDDVTDIKLQKKCRQLERLNGRLKEIVRFNLASEISPKDFAQLSCQQIMQYVAKKKQNESAESKFESYAIKAHSDSLSKGPLSFHTVSICADEQWSSGISGLSFWIDLKI